MNYPAPVPSSITAEVDDATMKLVAQLSEKRGMTSAAFAAEAIQRVAESEADFDAFIQAGIDAADRGELIPQDVVFADLRARRAQRHAR